MIQQPLYAPQIFTLKPMPPPPILDSGASHHFSPDHPQFQNYKELVSPEPIRAADGQTFSAVGKGDIQIELPNGDQKPTPIMLKSIYYSLHMAFTLMSVSCIDRAGFSLFIKGGTCVIQSLKSNIIGHIPQVRGLYHVNDSPTSSQHTHITSTTVKQILISELHQQMGHVNHEDLQCMVENGMVTSINLDILSKLEFCKACIKAKATHKPFSKESKTEYKSYSNKVVSGVWGPASVQSIGGNHYYNLYQDQSSHEEAIYFMKNKSDTFHDYKKYEAWVKVQRGAPIRIFSCDQGGEFMSKEFTEHLENAGTV
jgi:hypothetical protein